MEPVLIPLWPDAARALGLGRTRAFELAATGELETVQLGRKRLVHVDAVREFGRKLREAHSKGAA